MHFKKKNEYTEDWENDPLTGSPEDIIIPPEMLPSELMEETEMGEEVPLEEEYEQTEESDLSEEKESLREEMENESLEESWGELAEEQTEEARYNPQFEEIEEKQERIRGGKSEGTTPPAANPRSRRTSRARGEFVSSRLNWLVADFQNITSSTYEAVMVASLRAREIARQQKIEIDKYFSKRADETQPVNEEESPQRGIDPFNHIKPTVLALQELKEEKIKFRYFNSSATDNPSSRAGS